MPILHPDSGRASYLRALRGQLCQLPPMCHVYRDGPSMDNWSSPPVLELPPEQEFLQVLLYRLKERVWMRMFIEIDVGLAHQIHCT